MTELTSDDGNSQTPASHPLDAMRETETACTRGLYISPSFKAIVDPAKPLDVVWDPTCFTNTTTTHVDIFLKTGLDTIMQEWRYLDPSSGHLNVNLNTTWWNTSATLSAYVDILPSTAVFLGSGKTIFPSGPIFTVLGSSGERQSAHQDSALNRQQFVGATVGSILGVTVLGAAVWAIMRARAKTARERLQWQDAMFPISRY